MATNRKLGKYQNFGQISKKLPKNLFEILNPGSGWWKVKDCSEEYYPLCEVYHDFVDYENIPCPECYNGVGAYYSGHISTTVTNKTCARWDTFASSPHASYMANYCRNPNDAVFMMSGTFVQNLASKIIFIK